MCGFDSIWRGDYFGGEPFGIAEVEVRAQKLKNGKAAFKDEITGEMIKGGVRFLEEGIEWRLPGLLYADFLFLCGESEEDLRAIVGRFIEVCRRGLKVNASKSKVMVLNEEEGLEC